MRKTALREVKLLREVGAAGVQRRSLLCTSSLLPRVVSALLPSTAACAPPPSPLSAAEPRAHCNAAGRVPPGRQAVPVLRVPGEDGCGQWAGSRQLPFKAGFHQLCRTVALSEGAACMHSCNGAQAAYHVSQLMPGVHVSCRCSSGGPGAQSLRPARGGGQALHVAAAAGGALHAWWVG